MKRISADGIMLSDGKEAAPAGRQRLDEEGILCPHKITRLSSAATSRRCGLRAT
jgi:hypothetical protein